MAFLPRVVQYVAGGCSVTMLLMTLREIVEANAIHITYIPITNCESLRPQGRVRCRRYPAANIRGLGEITFGIGSGGSR